MEESVAHSVRIGALRIRFTHALRTRPYPKAVWGSPKFSLNHSFLFRELADGQLPQQYPAATAKLLLKVLRNTEVVHYDLDKVEDLVRRIAGLHTPLDTLKDICNELAELGYPRAAVLEAWLQRGDF